MIKTIIKKSTLLFPVMTLFGLLFFAPVTLHAQTPKDAACQGLALTGGACDTNPADPNSSNSRINKILTQVLNIFSIVVGFTAVIMIMIGGFRYITSGGDSSNTASAKNTILYAVIGLVIVAFAQIIVQFVLGRV